MGSASTAKTASAGASMVLVAEIFLLVSTARGIRRRGAAKRHRRKLTCSVGFNGLGLGLQYFPLQQLCTPSAYAVPDVAMGTLPAQQQPIIDSLLANNPWGNSPMVPALEGAVAYTKAWQLAHVWWPLFEWSPGRFAAG